MTAEPAKTSRFDTLGVWIIALLAGMSVLATLDAAGDYPALFEGPGITLDESFNVQMGVYQWRVLKEYHVALLHPDTIHEVFGPGSNYNPDHPPLGRLWLGVWHDLTEWLFPPHDHPANEFGVRFVTDCARVGSATAFALTLLMVGLIAHRWYGRAGGVTAAMSLVFMPRVFGHAHLASLETFMNLTYTATILAVAQWWQVRRFGLSRPESQPSEGGTTNVPLRTATLTGILFGLALLSKMQAILIPPVVGLWALWHWRMRAIKPLLVFGLVGFGVFLVGWPWLWLDPIAHLREYFARTTQRAVLHCYYFGQVWADKDVPWHYPFVMFAVTVPVGLHALGLLGVTGRLTRSVGEGAVTLSPCARIGLLGEPREQLLLLAALMPLVLFALPGVAVYDGERLFLVSFPIWSLLIGRGAAVLLEFLRAKAELGVWSIFATARARQLALASLLTFQSVGLIAMCPCHLSYYNLFVGGLWGAERLGFERTYWGDSLTRGTLAEVSESVGLGGTVVVQPVLHQFQLRELLTQSPILRRQLIQLLTEADAEKLAARGQSFERLVFVRKADLPPPIWNPERPQPRNTLAKSGVPLTRWWHEDWKSRP
jgi:4-amino-4-deoxy-L-arabinose transferase-like glycosyltransferase